MEYLIIGNYNSVVFKDVFGKLRDGSARIGVSPRSMTFNTMYGTERQINAVWFTNLKNEHDHITPTATYSSSEYPKYDNYNVIEISRAKDIPADYLYEMGVPITALPMIDTKEYDIIAPACGNSWNNYREELEALGFDPEQKYGGGLGAPILNGKAVYARLIIKLKRPPMTDGQSNSRYLDSGKSKPAAKIQKNKTE